MIDRRTVLRRGAGAVGTAALAGAAGCLFDESDGDGSGTDFLTVLPDPAPAVVPSFHAAYSYDPVPVLDSLDGTDALPDLAGNLVDVIEALPETGLDDVDRLSGQRLRQVGHSGSDVGLVTPRGSDLVAEGAIDVDGAASWLTAQDSFTDLGDERGYRRFGDGSVADAFVVDGDALAFGTRRATNLGTEGVASTAIDGLEDGATPAAERSPELAAAIDALPGTTATAATSFDLVAERPDTGTEAYDATAASLVAAGVDADVGEDETELLRVLRYRRDRRAGVETVQSAVDAATESGHFHDGSWSVSWSTRTVRIEGTVSTAALREDPTPLRRAVPVPGYDDLTAPVDPRDLGRSAPPRVPWEAELLDDDRVAIVHGGGPSVQDLEIAYDLDGERVHERWEGPVGPDDRFETSQSPDGGSVLDLVWARGTVDETILVRVELPDDGG